MQGIVGEGADRFRNPDEDQPEDFDARREEYYAAIGQPRRASGRRKNLEMLGTDSPLLRFASFGIRKMAGGWRAPSPDFRDSRNIEPLTVVRHRGVYWRA
jgi:hypothetical protein